jgi:hypothetical protein
VEEQNDEEGHVQQVPKEEELEKSAAPNKAKREERERKEDPQQRKACGTRRVADPAFASLGGEHKLAHAHARRIGPRPVQAELSNSVDEAQGRDEEAHDRMQRDGILKGRQPARG